MGWQSENRKHNLRLQTNMIDKRLPVGESDENSPLRPLPLNSNDSLNREARSLLLRAVWHRKSFTYILLTPANAKRSVECFKESRAVSLK